MFKKKFKYYKSKNPTPDLFEVLDLHKNDEINQNKVRKVILSKEIAEYNFFGLILPNKWEIYELIDNPGLLYIKNPFTKIGQRYWITKCLQDYTKKPNKSNLDIHNLLSNDINWWQECLKSNNKILMEKLRWITMGFHHDWDTKVYSNDSKSDFPKDLGLLCEYLTKCLGFETFHAEAAIINYYHMDSTLSGHTDHSEVNLNAPLFSFSFGQTAIFLIGGRTLEDTPTPLFINNGDIVVMSKEARLCYHGVPKILKNINLSYSNFTLEDFNEIPKEFSIDVVNNCKNENFWQPFLKYVENSRININVRQVLHNEQKQLTDT